MMNLKELYKLFKIDGYRFTRNHNRTIFQVNYYIKKHKETKKMQYIKELPDLAKVMTSTVIM